VAQVEGSGASNLRKARNRKGVRWVQKITNYPIQDTKPG